MVGRGLQRNHSCSRHSVPCCPADWLTANEGFTSVPVWQVGLLCVAKRDHTACARLHTGGQSCTADTAVLGESWFRTESWPPSMKYVFADCQQTRNECACACVRTHTHTDTHTQSPHLQPLPATYPYSSFTKLSVFLECTMCFLYHDNNLSQLWFNGIQNAINPYSFSPSFAFCLMMLNSK